MPADPRKTLLCCYHYDPLDRLTDYAPAAEAGIQRFYCKSRLATEIQGAVQRSVFQHDDQLLAQLQRENLKAHATLLATDLQRSVLTALDETRPHPLSYTPYGHRPAESGLLSLLGFNGERPDPVTGHYLLGNGYRAFNPVLMRFNSPDSWSPFGEGGLNAYAYCGGDPRNWKDSTGHTRIFPLFKALSEYRTAKANLNIPQTSEKFPKPVVTDPKNLVNKSLAAKNKKSWTERVRYAELKELSKLIEQNEARLPISEKAKYTSAVPNDDLATTEKFYNLAKNTYKFKGKFPDTEIREWYEGKLDVGHFDITIMHHKNLVSSKSHNFSRDPRGYYRATILRAVYIRESIGIDLMSVRQ
ncbi:MULTISPECIES: RHS repeat-associated core domain-containing protein [unclassified Pseudomonas]|uniref:RHS repeat-associated core domain-containing protein n=1 Tax=unclassified Pseudomonas TaxID=196821 RepID=UPI0039B739C6